MSFYYKKMRKNYAVIAAGGLGTRLKNFEGNLHTKVLIDIDGFSMISSQINQLQNWGLKDFIVITNPEFHDLIVRDIYTNFKNINISFVTQTAPKGIADALSYAESEVEEDSIITFILGDNFFGENPLKAENYENFKGAKIFATNVENPQEFGVMELNSQKKLIDLHEKPDNFVSSLAVVGLYLYDKSCFEFIKKLKPSSRGELEVTDLNKLYLSKNLLSYEVIDSWWIDAGTEDRINELKNLI